MMFNMVLVSPEIPPNTGNVGRSILATGGKLHLVRPLGFSLDDRNLRRAGLDYWEDIDVTVWESLNDIVAQVPAEKLHFLSTRGKYRYDQHTYRPGDWFILGNESRGLDPDLLARHEERTFHIPMSNLSVRSLNLSSAAAVVLYEALRQNGFGGRGGAA